MKVVFTGGGTGGHFYPIVAIAEAIRDEVRDRRLIAPKLYYMAPSAYDMEALFENEIVFVACPAGKMRRYFSLQNITDWFLTITGTIYAFLMLLRLYPDVIVSKGGYASVPTVTAAAILGIPIIIHESDAKPGRANLFAARFAHRIAIAFDSAAAYFPKNMQKKVARTGIPVRKDLMKLEREGAAQYLDLDPAAPTILVIGGSSGSLRMNETLLAALPELVNVGNVIHQTGKDHFKSMEKTAPVALAGNQNASRYHPFPYLSTLSMRRAAGAADLVISRAGATAITEIAIWGTPAILIPIPEEISHDQRTNAYSYAHTGAATVIEEVNLSPHVLVSEVKRIIENPELRMQMKGKSAGFANLDAAKIIAEEVLSIGLTHEKV
ncbi:UDP-N-acetylglucosamine--N-acetylmuramyl-(pentapeptide) pyrophosphoryl-undecaprenol N-acetylglucosamine transferase [Patescibacteria group bacterium]|nr:UDP-N-acetylglucosamine--N-acetylmuramyl-(pentapeptide) pyrophosphoryl-undecaprenol N-acetylglucosamine transferase [Patescibacteria group bacterium]